MRQKLTPPTLALLTCAAILLLLAVWSLSFGLRLDNQTMLVKGGVLILYAAFLAGFAWWARPRMRVFMLFGLLMLLIGGEIITRLMNEPPEDPDYRQGAPYLMFTGQPDGFIEDEDIPLNPLGYRDLPPLPKPADEYRVIMLGGSTVFNGSPREFSLAGAIEAELNAAGFPNARVYNWGVYSQVSGQELVTILLRAVDYQPDMIFVYNGSNDLTLPYFFDPRPGYPFDFLAYEGGRRIIEGEYGVYDLVALLLRPTSLGYTLFQFEIEEQITRRHQLEEAADAGSAAWEAAILAAYGGNLAKMCQLTEAFNFRLVAALQPMIFFKDTLSGAEPGLLGPESYQEHTRRLYAGARQTYSALSSTYADLNCHFLDASAIIQTESAELYVDPVHLNDRGNQIVGRRLAGLLAPLIGR